MESLVLVLALALNSHLERSRSWMSLEALLPVGQVSHQVDLGQRLLSELVVFGCAALRSIFAIWQSLTLVGIHAFQSMLLAVSYLSRLLRLNIVFLVAASIRYE